MKVQYMLEFQQKEAFMKNYLSLLHDLPLFEGISESDIPVILKKLGARTKKYTKNNFIRFAGDPADFIGIVLEGNIQILQDDFYGKRSIIATFGKGTLFAEAFACAGVSILPVNIIASDSAEIMFINSNHIFELDGCECGFHHKLITNLLKIMAQKNILLNTKLQYSSHKTTAEKIMAYLNDQARIHKSNEFTISFDRQGLADYLGVERSAMSAEISKLVKLGIIETRRSYFKILKDYVLEI